MNPSTRSPQASAAAILSGGVALFVHLALAAMLLVFSVPRLLAQETEVPAAEAKPEASEEAPADPFVKRRGGAAEGSEAEEAGPSEYVNTGLLVQHIEVANERWEAWLAENAIPTAADAEGLRREVEKWIAAGEAELAETSLAMGRSGSRTKAESFLTVIYGSGFHPDDSSAQPFPAANETHFVGSIHEFDPVLGQDGSLALSLSSQRTTYLGEAPPRPETGVQEGDLRWPLFATQQHSGSATLGPDHWALLGSFAALERPETHRTLLFARPAIHRFAAGDQSEGRPDPFPGDARPEATITFTWLELPHDALNTLMMDAEDFSVWIGGGLREAANGAGGKVQREQSLRVQSGLRTKSESVSWLRFPTELDYPEEGGGPFATPNAVETWNIGTTAEVDTVIGRDGTIDLSFAPEWTAHGGTSVLHRVLVEGEWQPNYTMPRIHKMQVSTQLSLPPGVPVLAAILTPPDEEGWPAPERKVLLFVEVSF